MRVTVACVASVSSRVIARKLEREQKKKKKKLEGGGGERIRLPAKRLLIFLGCRVIEKLPFRDGMMF